MRGSMAPWFASVAFAACWMVAAAPARGTSTDEYEIGPGDVLKVVVIGQAQMTGDFPVDPEGMVNFPILGKIG